MRTSDISRPGRMSEDNRHWESQSQSQRNALAPLSNLRKYRAFDARLLVDLHTVNMVSSWPRSDLGRSALASKLNLWCMSAPKTTMSRSAAAQRLPKF